MGSVCSCDDDDNDPVNGGYYSSVSASRRDPNKHKKPSDVTKINADDGEDSGRFNKNGKFSPKMNDAEEFFNGNRKYSVTSQQSNGGGTKPFSRKASHEIPSSSANANNYDSDSQHQRQQNQAQNSRDGILVNKNADYFVNANTADNDDKSTVAVAGHQKMRHVGSTNAHHHLPGATMENDFGTLSEPNSPKVGGGGGGGGGASKRRPSRGDVLADHNHPHNIKDEKGGATPEQGCLSFEEDDLTPMPGAVDAAGDLDLAGTTNNNNNNSLSLANSLATGNRQQQQNNNNNSFTNSSSNPSTVAAAVSVQNVNNNNSVLGVGNVKSNYSKQDDAIIAPDMPVSGFMMLVNGVPQFVNSKK